MTITAREMYLMEAAFEMGQNSDCNGGWGFDMADAELIESDMPENLRMSDGAKILEEVHRETVLLGNATYAYPTEAQKVAGKIFKHLLAKWDDEMRGR